MHQALLLFLCPTTAPYGHSTAGGSGLDEAGCQIMSKQSTAQARAMKPVKSAPVSPFVIGIYIFHTMHLF